MVRAIGRRSVVLVVFVWATLGAGADAEEGRGAWERLLGAARAAEGSAPGLAVDGFGFGVLRQEPPSDFTLQFRYRQGTGVGAVLLPAPDAGRTPRLHHVLLREDAIVLCREAEGRLEEFAVGRPGVPAGAWQDVEILRRGVGLEVRVGSGRRVQGEDSRGLASGRIALGAYMGTGFAFEDVRLEAVEAAAGDTALETGGILLGTGLPAVRRAWHLAGGARLVGDAVREVEVPPGAEAAWNTAPVSSGSLAFRVRGAAQVLLGSVEESGRGRNLVLSIAPQGLSLRLGGGADAVAVGEASLELAPTAWHDVSVHADRMWVQVDVGYGPALTTELPGPLVLGSLAFRATDSPAHVADVQLTPWPSSRTQGLRDLLRQREPTGGGPPAAPSGNLVPATGPRDVPLRIARYRYGAAFPRVPARIDPGVLPPNFVHTWVLDVRGIDVLEIPTKGLAEILLGPDDRVTLYDLAGLAKQPPAPLGPVVTRTSRAEDLRLDLGKTVPMTVKGISVRRIFLVLETSAAEAPRRFRLDGFRNGADNDGDEEVLLLGDDLDAGGNVLWAGRTPTGTPKDIPSPFKPGTHTGFNSYAPLGAEDGWYLLGRNVTDPSTRFFALVYYNERLAVLRLLLYNLDMPLAVSGSTVTISLRGFSPSSAAGSTHLVAEPLQGAFFPLHPNPKRWSTVTVPLVGWHLNSWTCLEVPVAYPMGSNLAVDAARAAPQPPSWYRSLYEEPFAAGRRGVFLEFVIDSYDTGTLSGEWHGKAVGNAVQKAGAGSPGGPGLIDLAKAAAKAGGDIFSGARSIYDGIKGYRDQVKKDGSVGGDVLKQLGSVLSLGSSVFSGGFGIAGAAYEFINGLFGSKVPPLELALELELAGSLSGSVKIEHTQGPVWRCYLPGRFPMDEAYRLGLHADDPDVLAAAVPAYDRTVGLFGYRYNPGELRFRVFRGDGDAAGDPAPSFVFPASEAPDPAKGWLEESQSRPVLDRFLPVIFNPYAEIVPATPTIVGSQVHEEKPADWQAQFAPAAWWKRTRWLVDDSWQTHVVPEPGDATFPRQTTLHALDTVQMWVEVRLADPYRLTLPPTSSVYQYSLDFPGGLAIQVTPRAGYAPTTYRGFQAAEARDFAGAPWYAGWVRNEDPGGADPSLPRAFEAGSPHPLADVVFHWAHRYFWYGRSRQAADGSVPRFAGKAHFRSPVTLEVRRAVGAAVPGAKPPVLHLAPSGLLR